MVARPGCRVRQPCALCAGLRRGARAPPGHPAAARCWHGPSSLRAKRPPGERPARGLHVQGLPHSTWAPRRSGRAALGARAGGTGRTLELSLGPLQAPPLWEGFFFFFLFPTSLQVSRCPTPFFLPRREAPRVSGVTTRLKLTNSNSRPPPAAPGCRRCAAVARSPGLWRGRASPTGFYCARVPTLCACSGAPTILSALPVAAYLPSPFREANPREPQTPARSGAGSSGV